MVTDIVIQEIPESTESDMNEVCDLMIGENPFFDVDMNDIDEKSHTETDEVSDFEEPLDMIDSDEMCTNKSFFSTRVV